MRGRTAIVLSGGGARGAYEAGVLSFIFQDVARRLGRSPRFDIITGTSVGAIHDALDAMRTRADSTPTLATITVPTLIVCGDEDVLTPVKESEALRAGIADAQLAVIPGAGHVSCVEHPAAFNALLASFIQARFP